MGIWNRTDDEFLVDTDNFDVAVEPVIAALDGGGYIIVWTATQDRGDASSPDGSGNAVFAQRYDNDHNPVGGLIQINSVTSGDQHLPAVEGLPGGGFIVSFTTPDRETMVRTFDSDGVATGVEVQVNTYASGWQQNSDMAVLSNGNTIIVYETFGYDGSEWGVGAQIMDSTGAKLGSEFLVNTSTSGWQRAPEVVALDGGGFVVVFHGASDGSDLGIYAQMFENDGTKVGGQIPVNTTTAGTQYVPEVAPVEGGGFVVIWTNPTGVGTETEVLGQIFDSSGSPVGSELLISQTSGDQFTQPEIIVTSEGDFLVTYHSATDFDVYMRQFAPDGTPRGDEVPLTEGLVDAQRNPSMARLDNGEIVAIFYTENDGNADIEVQVLTNLIEGTEGSDNPLNGTADADEIYGLGGNDRIFAFEGDDVVDGGTGSDLLFGGDGNDELLGGDGFDQLFGGAGDDILNGGNDYDYARYDTYLNPEDAPVTGVTVDLNIQGVSQDTGGGGVDTLVDIEGVWGTDFFDTLTGDGTANVLVGLGGGDTISGGAGDDFVIVDGGDATLDGGADTDGLSFTFLTTGITLDIGALAGGTVTEVGTITAVNFEMYEGTRGADTITGSANAETIVGEQGNDTISGGAGTDFIVGDGYIFLDSGTLSMEVDLYDFGEFIPEYNGNDILSGDAGDDTIYGLGGDDEIYGGDDADTIYVGAGNDTAYGDAGDDVLYSESGINYLYGGTGNDVFHAGNGEDRMYGGDGDDTFYGNADSEAVRYYGGAGADIIYGSNSADVGYGQDDGDTIYGFGGNDYLAGQAGDDYVEGGTGNDHIRGDGGGTDTLLGGDGFDTISYDFHFDGVGGVAINLTTNTATSDSSSATLSGFEDIRGSLYDDVLTGDSGDNWIRTVGGNDEVYGEAGNDLVELSQGDHVVRGGDGNDTLTFRGIDIGTGVTIDLDDQGAGLTEMILLQLDMDGFENVSGTIWDDTISGDANGNYLTGDGGNDVLTGDGGNDYLYGDGMLYVERSFNVRDSVVFIYSNQDEVTLANTTDQPGYGVAGNDLLDGGEGDDYLFGGAGDDILIGGAGADYMDGGEGIDTADYSGATEGIFIRAYSGFNYDGGAAGDTHVSIENVIGSAFNDQFWGTFNGEDNIFWGGDGVDGFSGFGGNDAFYGEGGYDYLSNQWGTEYYDGGDGNDIVSYYWTDLGQGVTIDLNVAVQDNGAFGIDTIVNVESGQGTRYDDIFYGTDGDNSFWGSHIGGPDNQVKGDNNDQAYMGGGDDHVQLGIGNHIVDGGTGNDTLMLSDVGMLAGVTVDLKIAGVDQDFGHGSINISGIENLSGSTQSDLLIGDVQANILAGDAGDDTLEGGKGWDTLYGDSRYALEIVGTDLEWNIIEATDEGGTPLPAGDDSLYGGDGNDAIYGEGGNDLLAGGTGADYLDGGDGLDTASWADSDTGVDVRLHSGVTGGGAAGDTVVSIEGIVGTDYDDRLEGHFGGTEIYAGGGNDLIVPQAAGNIVDAGAGDDTILSWIGHDFIDGGDGFDIVYYSWVYNWTDLQDGVVIDLNLQQQADWNGSQGDEFVSVEGVVGTRLSDTLTGTGGADLLWGDAERGTGQNNDTIKGNAGDDLIIVGEGNHTITGNGGQDLLEFSGSDQDTNFGDGFTFDLRAQGAAQDTGRGMMTVVGVEHLTGSYEDDFLTGDTNANQLSGSGGADAIFGGDGNDILRGDATTYINMDGWFLTTDGVTNQGDDLLYGELGDDAIYGNDGNDRMFGGDGNDSMWGEDGNDTLKGDAGGDHLSGGSGDDILKGGSGKDAMEGGADLDIMRGNGGNDTMDGGDGDDEVYGGGGSDVVRGGASGDIVSGGGGGDTVYGDNGNDQLFGDGGNDWLDGGFGDDGMTGGFGSDLYYFNDGYGDDTILDFEAGETIAFDASMGLSFGDLVIDTQGDMSVITWGTDDSITVFGDAAASISEGDFWFGAADPQAPAMVAKEPLAEIAQLTDFRPYEAKFEHGLDVQMVDEGLPVA